MNAKKAIVEALKELTRVVLLAVIPVLISSLEQGVFNWKVILVVAAIASLKAIDKFISKWDGIELKGLTGF